MKRFVSHFTGASVLAFAAAAAPAVAQEAGGGVGGIQDIVVTAQKREQRLQDVPVAITALTSESLAANRITTVRDLDSVSPNLTVRQIVGGGQLPSYSMRGVVTIGSSIGVDRGIALYVDGVYIGNAQGSIFELGDIARIEVLRGPQGTLFGRNATGGAISITSSDPTGEFGMRQTVSYGNYDQFRSVTHLDTPSFGDLSASFNFVHTERRGDIRNLGAGTTWDMTGVGAGRYTSPKYLGGNNTEAASANILYDGEAVRAIYRFDWSDSTATAPGQGIIYASPFAQRLFAAQPDQSILTPVSHTRPDAVNNAGAVPSTIKTQGHSLTLTADLTDELSIKNIASYRKSSYISPMSQIDGAGGLINPGSTAVPQLGILLGAAANTTIGAPLFIQSTLTQGREKQYSNEFQVNYDSDLLTFTGGLFYYRQKAYRGSIGVEGVGLGQARSGSFQLFPNFVVPFPGRPTGYGAIESNVRVISKAAYGQVELHATDQLDLIGGLRYTHDDKKGRDNTIVSAANPPATGSFPIEYSKGKLTYNVGVNYKFNQDVLVYAKYVTGFISGGFFASRSYDPETAKSFEAGIKADWFDRRLRTNLSVFHVKYGDLQLTTSGTSLGLDPALTQVVFNAGDARAQGFELETTIQPLRQLTFNASVGFTDFKYTRLRPEVSNSVYAFLVHERPKWTSNLSATYESDPILSGGRLVARLDGNFKSKHNAVSAIPAASALFGIDAAEQQRFIQEQRVKGYWLVNGRLAIQDIDMNGGAKATFAVWGRNLFDVKQISYAPSLTSVVSADYERARTYGVDLSIEF